MYFYAMFRDRIARLSLELAMGAEPLLEQFVPGVRNHEQAAGPAPRRRVPVGAPMAAHARRRGHVPIPIPMPPAPRWPAGGRRCRARPCRRRGASGARPGPLSRETDHRPMPRPNRRSAGLFSPNLTPLLDVVLQLITFFMMLVHFGSRLEGAGRPCDCPWAPPRCAART